MKCDRIAGGMRCHRPAHHAGSCEAIADHVTYRWRGNAKPEPIHPAPTMTGRELSYSLARSSGSVACAISALSDAKPCGFDDIDAKLQRAHKLAAEAQIEIFERLGAMRRESA